MAILNFEQLKAKARQYPNNKEIANTIKVIKAEIKSHFNYENYYSGDKTWYNINVQTQPLFCSYGQIGYVAWGKDILPFTYDWENKTFEITWVWWEEEKESDEN